MITYLELVVTILGIFIGAALGIRAAIKSIEKDLDGY